MAFPWGLLPLSAALVPLAYLFGIAGQYIGFSLALVMAAIGTRGAKEGVTFGECCRVLSSHLSLSCLFLAWGVMTTAINPAMADESSVRIIVGHLTWVLLPLAVFYYGSRLSESVWNRGVSWVAVLCGLWALVAISQVVWPWRFSGSSITVDVGRPRGFYSHPLTFAYAALLLFPLAWDFLFRGWRRWQGWLLGGGCLIIAVMTLSRVVQVLALGALIALAWIHLSGRLRAWLLAAVATGVVGIALTDNPVRAKFYETISDTPVDRFSDYPDDRLAFWHAHWLMVKERPLMGHGMDLNTAYRLPYYERIGLADFRKPYAAHNMYLQVLAETGIVGLSLWLAWFATQIMASLKGHSSTRFAVGLTWAVMLLGGISQNWFQDAEVRHGLALFVGVMAVQTWRSKCLETSAPQ